MKKIVKVLMTIGLGIVTVLIPVSAFAAIGAYLLGGWIPGFIGAMLTVTVISIWSFIFGTIIRAYIEEVMDEL